MNQDEIRARVTWAVEVIGDGDPATAADALLSLLDDLDGPEARGRARCRWCPVTGWAGEIQRHEGVVHAHELCDLEEQRRAA